MHRIPQFFTRKEKTAMDPRKTRRKPRLDRRNAAKYFDYDATSSSSSLDDSSSSSSLVTRSLDLSDKTSFRVEGVDGEFERICRSLGLSGPEDFAIPTAAWESRKIRSSSDILPRSRLNHLEESPKETERESDVVGVSELCDRVLDTVGIRDGTELAELRGQPGERSCSITHGGGSCGDGGGISRSAKEGTELTRDELEESIACCISSNQTGGIKGVRPPVLKPPPAMTLPVVDNACSTWDIFRDFGPKDDRELSVIGVFSSSDEEEEEDEEKEREVARATMKTEEEVVLSESCSFTTSNDDDSSSTTTEPKSNNISPNGRFKRSITYWEKGDLLGRGSFGSVYEGISDDGFFFAVKEVSLLDHGSQGKQSIFQLEQEIALLSQFEHENIVQYYGTDKDESKLYIFLELVTKGSLQSLYQRYNLKDSQVSAYTRQILLGLEYLHDRNVVHRDIKCANILVDANGSVKLADFGLAKATKLNDVKSCKGTPFWMAPEVVNNKNRGYGLPADIWSLGCTVLEMLTRQIPYSHLESMQALFKIGKGVPPPIPDHLSKDARDFILKCLQTKPSDRPTAAQLLDQSFVKKPLPTFSGSPSPRLLGKRH